MNVPNFLNVNEEAEVLFTIGPNGAMQAYKKLAGASEWTLAGYTHNANGELVYDFLQNDLNNKVHPVVDTDRKNLWVGQDNWSHGQGWEGSINDVRVWTEPVSPVAPPEQTSCNFEPGIKSGRDWQARMDEMIGDTSTKFCSEFTFKKNTAYWASPGHFIHELPIVGELKIPGSYGGKFSQTGAAKTKTVDDCKEACAQVSECAGFSYVGDDMLANSGPRTECWFYKKEAPCGGRKDSPTYWRSYTKNSVLNECAS